MESLIGREGVLDGRAMVAGMVDPRDEEPGSSSLPDAAGGIEIGKLDPAVSDVGACVGDDPFRAEREAAVVHARLERDAAVVLAPRGLLRRRQGRRL